MSEAKGLPKDDPFWSNLPSATFDWHITKDVPDILYHYTTQQGLISIVTRAELWATKIQYMNDSTEFRLAKILATDRINKRLQEEKNPETREKLLKLDEASGSPNLNVFVACFCEEGDLLSQWRGYSGNHGFSIGVEGKRLAQNTNSEGFTFARCIYDQDLQSQIIDEGITAALEKTDPYYWFSFNNFLSKVGALFKNALFHEEREWRLVSGMTSVMHEKVGFRPGRSTINPYLAVPLGLKAESVINHIIVGPCPHMELSENSVSMLLLKQEIQKKKVGIGLSADTRRSDVPFRNW